MVERCPDKTEVEGSIPSARTQRGIEIYFHFSLSAIYKSEAEGFLAGQAILSARIIIN